jgi:hypothetical protein
MSVPTRSSAAADGAPQAPAAPLSRPLDAARADRVARIVAMLAQDVADARVIALLQRAGARPVLLKGPVTARRFYPGEARPRADCDLLVEPSRFSDAAAVLVAAGMRPLDPCPYATTFAHPSGQAVDLHWSLPVIRVSADRLWAVLSVRTVEFDLRGIVVETLDLPAHACHLAIHAVSVPMRAQAARRDLDRAAVMVPLESWRAALAVAADLGAHAAVAAALRTGSPDCRHVADALGLPPRVPFTQRLWLADDSWLLDARRLLRTVPPAHRRAVLRRWLLPTRAEIAGRVARTDIAAVAPVALPAPARLAWFRLRQAGLFVAACGRAALGSAGRAHDARPAATPPAPQAPGRPGYRRGDPAG